VKQFVVAHEEKEAAIFCNPPLSALQHQFSSTFLEHTKSGLQEYIVTVHCQASKRLVLEAYSEVKNDLGRHTCL
jgi:hypothetical protein